MDTQFYNLRKEDKTSVVILQAEAANNSINNIFIRHYFHYQLIML